MSRRFTLTDLPDGGLELSGPMFRTTPYRHALEILLLRRGAKGARTTEPAKNTVRVVPTAEPLDDVQAALVEALGGQKRNSIFDLLGPEG